MYPDEGLSPVDYYERFPPGLPEAHVFVVDPMLATGGSAVHALDAERRAHGGSRSCASSPRRRTGPVERRIPTWSCGRPPWTASSTSRPTSARASRRRDRSSDLADFERHTSKRSTSIRPRS